MDEDAEEELYDTFTKVLVHGIHHPVHFHSFVQGVSIFPFGCQSCKKLVFPFSTIGTCIKCNAVVHRTCCDRFRSVCPKIALETSFDTCTGATATPAPKEHSVAKMKSPAEEIINYDDSSILVCWDEKWRANLHRIWRNVMSNRLMFQNGSAQESTSNANTFDACFSNLQDSFKDSLNSASKPSSISGAGADTVGFDDYSGDCGVEPPPDAPTILSAANLSHLVSLISSDRTFIGFTFISILKLYLDANKSSTAVAGASSLLNSSSSVEGGSTFFGKDSGSDGGRSPEPQLNDNAKEAAVALIEDGRECMNTAIQSVLLWLGETSAAARHRQSSADASRSDSTGEYEGKLLTYSSIIDQRIHEEAMEWKIFVNAVENAALRWNNCALYKTIYRQVTKTCREKDADLRAVINRTFTGSATTSTGPSVRNSSPITANSRSSLMSNEAASHRFHMNPKLPPPESNTMVLLEEFERISKDAVSPLDKLCVLVRVLRLLAEDIRNTELAKMQSAAELESINADVPAMRNVPNPPSPSKASSSRIRSFSSASVLRHATSRPSLAIKSAPTVNCEVEADTRAGTKLDKPVADNDAVQFNEESIVEEPPSMVVVDADQLVTRLCEIIRLSYVSGSGINWFAESLFMTNLLFTGIKSYTTIDQILLLSDEKNDGVLSLSYSRKAGKLSNRTRSCTSERVKKAEIAANRRANLVLNEDWLLGAEGYALVTLQQGLDSILFEHR